MLLRVMLRGLPKYLKHLSLSLSPSPTLQLRLLAHHRLIETRLIRLEKVHLSWISRCISYHRVARECHKTITTSTHTHSFAHPSIRLK